MTLERLIFKDLSSGLHNQAGICITTTSPSHHLPLPWQGKKPESSQNWNTILATKSLRAACPSQGIPSGHPVLPGAFQSDQAGLGSSAKQGATS